MHAFYRVFGAQIAVFVLQRGGDIDVTCPEAVCELLYFLVGAGDLFIAAYKQTGFISGVAAL